MNHGTPALKAALQSNLNQLESYGVTLVTAERLEEEVVKHFFKETTTKPETTEKRQLLDAETVKYLVQSGNRTIHIEKGTIITPLARDVAHRLAAEIISDR
jgi:16S rRNA C1402 N4-methylase RsmH